ncbi:MAG TPA: DUF58 domain-containing protein [bacterium]|nr:DUF58 domain-containing protein [bacterium]HQG44311.1 DUF58 domain-containing protein [bacterium]HQI49262.1 DUF58 domain-containing protein [bacterium]HQJ63648.1 DUF58 domain-containing protein [bacterium]
MAAAAPNYRQFLEPATVSKLHNLNLVARLVVEGFITGLHRSPYHGFSVEFAEHRPYMPGDDIRHIDWKVYAKTHRYYLKEYEEETNLKAWLLLDASASMGYGSGAVTKLQYATFLAAALAYLMIGQRDAVGLVTFDKTIRRYLPPRSISSYLSLLLQEMQNTTPSAITDVAQTLHQMAERIHRRGLIMLFSDLLDEPQRIISGLKHFRHNHHEVIVFHLLDPLERSFDFSEEGLFIDIENGDTMTTQPWHIRGDYRRLMAGHIETLRRQCRENRIDYVLMDTGVSFEGALLQYLSKRQRIGG